MYLDKRNGKEEASPPTLKYFIRAGMLWLPLGGLLLCSVFFHDVVSQAGQQQETQERLRKTKLIFLGPRDRRPAHHVEWPEERTEGRGGHCLFWFL